MITLQNDDKQIEINFDTYIEKKKVVTETDMYKVILPEVKCSNEEDAYEVMTKVNDYISKLVKDLIKK